MSCAYLAFLYITWPVSLSKTSSLVKTSLKTYKKKENVILCYVLYPTILSITTLFVISEIGLIC